MNLDRITTVSELLGLVLFAIGAGLAWFPAGVMSLGAGLVLVGFLAGRP